MDGDQAVDTAMFTPETIAEADEDVSRLFNRGVSDTVVAADRVVTVLWPVPTLVIIGAGAIAESTTRAVAFSIWVKFCPLNEFTTKTMCATAGGTLA